MVIVLPISFPLNSFFSENVISLDGARFYEWSHLEQHNIRAFLSYTLDEQCPPSTSAFPTLLCEPTLSFSFFDQADSFTPLEKGSFFSVGPTSFLTFYASPSASFPLSLVCRLRRRALNSARTRPSLEISSIPSGLTPSLGVIFVALIVDVVPFSRPLY